MLRQKYKGKDIPEEELDNKIEKEVKKRMKRSDIKRGKTETNEEALERIDFDAKIEEIGK